MEPKAEIVITSVNMTSITTENTFECLIIYCTSMFMRAWTRVCQFCLCNLQCSKEWGIGYKENSFIYSISLGTCSSLRQLRFTEISMAASFRSEARDWNASLLSPVEVVWRSCIWQRDVSHGLASHHDSLLGQNHTLQEAPYRAEENWHVSARGIRSDLKAFSMLLLRQVCQAAKSWKQG